MSQTLADDDSDGYSGDGIFHSPKPNGAPSHQHATSPKTAVDDTFTTQPTQILDTPVKLGLNGHHHGSSPTPVQVAASSPAAPLSSSKPNGVSHSNASGFSHPMAPPGTEFRPPSQWPQDQTQAQTQTYDSDDGELSSSSAGANNVTSRMKPSVFSKGSRQNGADTAQINESPSAAFGSFVSQYAHSTTPTKRSNPDALAESYARGRPVKAPRLAGDPKLPEDLAWFVDDNLNFKMDDIPDYRLKGVVEDVQNVLPGQSIYRIYQAVRRKKGRRDEATLYLGEMEQKVRAYEESVAAARSRSSQSQNDAILISDDELQVNRAQPKLKAKQEHRKQDNIANRYSNRYSKTSAKPKLSDSEDEELEAPVKVTRKRLHRPGQAATEDVSGKKRSRDEDSDDEVRAPKRTETTALSSPPETLYAKPSARAVGSDDSEGEMDTSQDDDLDLRVLKNINEASEVNLRDLSTMSADVVAAVMAQRPFASLDEAREVVMPIKSRGKSKKMTTTNVGDRLVDATLEMLAGYEALDSLVGTCKKLGTPILAKMKEWGLDMFGGDRNGELEMTTIKNGDNTGLLKQPANMSEDLTMKDYQIAGLNWLALLYRHGLSAILADDMGLGKTCQVIAFLAHLKDAGLRERVHLVIVPGSTLENWLREMGNFCPDLRVEPYYGGIKERPAMQDAIRNELEDIDVVITTYDIASKDTDARFLRKLEPEVCVYDEAHQLKNSTTSRYQQLMRIPAKKMRLLLTGTPLQNNLVELGSMLGFLMPDMFSVHQESIQHVFKQRAKVNTRDDGDNHDALLSAERVARAREMLTPFILRRKKDQVLRQLPKKTNVIRHCDLKSKHADIYKEVLSRYATAASQKDSKNAKTAKSSTLMDLRKAAIHPLLLRRQYDDKAIDKIAEKHVELELMEKNATKEERAKKMQQAVALWSGMNDFQIHKDIQDTMSGLKHMLLKGSPWLDSDKVKALLEVLDEHSKEGHTTLVFSQFTQVMDILEYAFEDHGIPFFRLDGNTDMNQRQQIIDDFAAAAGSSSDDADSARRPVFMLSTRAGGQGINLTAADRVVIFDSGFNPQDDVQAENRAHRVGQTREVEVLRLVARGTVEEAIVALGERKLKLDELVAGGGGSGGSEANAVEREGAALVEQLLHEQLASGGAAKGGDAAADFMSGLKKAGLDMSAAAKGPLKR